MEPKIRACIYISTQVTPPQQVTSAPSALQVEFNTIQCDLQLGEASSPISTRTLQDSRRKLLEALREPVQPKRNLASSCFIAGAPTDCLG